MNSAVFNSVMEISVYVLEENKDEVLIEKGLTVLQGQDVETLFYHILEKHMEIVWV